ncbi:hypothetical protein [Streptomyces sp. AP-93]|uniref:hypothetical protein n=1 Tax=Streptomyces sp. AP-93 TaxID=2929048 RepID=UPI001FAFA02B|nr:hypothetical protein [Streptomyces sp. AP-93]MCJ0871205.1 hypothetical protein [Streptomyces sp. AP-93]
MQINRISVVGSLAGTVLLFGGAPAHAADPLVSLLDSLNVSDVSLTRILNPTVVLTNGGATTLQQAAEPLLATPATPAAAPAAPAAPAAAPAAPAAAPAAPARTVTLQAAPVLPGGPAQAVLTPAAP